MANRAIHELFANLAHSQVAGLKNKLTFLGVFLYAVKPPFPRHSSVGIPSLPKRRLGAKLDQFAVLVAASNGLFHNRVSAAPLILCKHRMQYDPVFPGGICWTESHQSGRVHLFHENPKPTAGEK